MYVFFSPVALGVRYFGWLRGKEMGCLFLPLYTFRKKPFSHLYFVVCSASNFSLSYNNNWCPYSYYQIQLKEKKKKQQKEEKKGMCYVKSMLFPVLSCFLYFWMSSVLVIVVWFIFMWKGIIHFLSFIFLFTFYLLKYLHSTHLYEHRFFMLKCGRCWLVYCGSKEYHTQHYKNPACMWVMLAS